MSIYKCGTCGVVSDVGAHLCKPDVLASRGEYCGSAPERIGQICQPMDQALAYQCSTCGRPTDKPDLICNPAPMR